MLSHTLRRCLETAKQALSSPLRESARFVPESEAGLNVIQTALRLTMHLYFHNHGIMKTDAALAALSALSQRTRLDVFRYLVQAGPQGAAVGSIADALKVAAPTLSFHLKELSRAGLVTGKQEGRFIRYTASFAAMNGLIDYLTENCCGGKPVLCAPSCSPKKSSTRRRKVLS